MIRAGCLSLLLMLGFAGYAQARFSCGTVFQLEQAAVLGELKPWFLKQHHPNYSFETQGQSDVKDQGALGVCHLYSITSQFEHRYQQRTHETLELSQAYLVYEYWFQTIRETLDGDELVSQINMGGQFWKDWQFVHSVGLMPAEAWAQNSNFNKSPSFGRVDEYMRNLLDRAILKARDLKGDAKKAVLARALTEAQGLVTQFMGSPPKDFTYKGAKYTARSFAQTFFPELGQPTREFVVLDEHKRIEGKTYEVNTYPDGVVSSLSLNEAETELRKALDSGSNVYLAFEDNGDFIDNATGIMTIGGFSFPNGGGPLSRALRSQNHVTDGGHAVQVVGYDLDPKSGQIVKFKIKNSWGQYAGDHGYFHMYRDYFRAFVSGFSVF